MANFMSAQKTGKELLNLNQLNWIALDINMLFVYVVLQYVC